MPRIIATIKTPKGQPDLKVNLENAPEGLTDADLDQLVRSRLPQIGAATGVALGAAGGSEEAEARIPKVRGTQGASIDPRFDPRVREQDRIGSLSVESTNYLPEIPTAKLADFEGKPFVTTMSDRTAAAEILQKINDVQLQTPVQLRGGQDFMFDPTSLGQVWASAPGPVKQIVNTALEMKRKTGEDPLLIPWRMAPTGGDFSTMTGQTMLSYAQSNMNKTNKRKLDRAMRKVVPEWKGIDDPQAMALFSRQPDAVRKRIKQQVLDKEFRDVGGLNLGEARLAVTDPRQLDAPVGGTQNVGIIDTSSPIITNSGHPDYPNAVPGSGIARLEDPPLITDLLSGPEATWYQGSADVGSAKQPGFENYPNQPVGRYVSNDFRRMRGLGQGQPLDDVTRRMLELKPYGGRITEDLLRDLQGKGYEVGSADPRLLGATAAATAGGLAGAPTAKEYFDTALPGLMGYGEMMVRGLGGIGWGLAESMADFETSTEAIYDNVVNRMQQLTSGMESTPQMEAVGSQIRENAESVLPRGVVDAYLRGLEPVAAGIENAIPGKVGTELGAAVRLGELVAGP